MREYLFRGKRKDNGKWVIGNLVSTSPDEVFILIGVTGHIKRDDYECYMVEVVPKTVGQFTGLKDKNGKEIYEGDIVGKGNGEIYWNDKHVQFRVRWHERVFRRIRGGNGEPLFANSEIAWEVIGNIHDNPELVNPALKEGVNIDMNNFDPNVKAEEATQEQAATESAAQDQAMEATQDSEEGTTEG